MAFQDADFKADPCVNIPRGLVFIGGSGRCLLSYPDNPSSPTVLEICIRRGYHTTVRTVSDPAHFYEVHGCSFFPSEIDRNPHYKMP